MENRFTAVFEKRGKWWVGHVVEIPGALTQGKTLKEARENLKEAAELILEANREIADEQLAGRDVIKEPLLVTVP